MSSAVSLADSFGLACVNLHWAVNYVNVKETTDHIPNSLLARRTSRATKLEPAGIMRKDLQVGQGDGRRGGARRATIARKPRRRVHCASHARNLGLLRRHAHRQLGLGQMTALNRE